MSKGNPRKCLGTVIELFSGCGGDDSKLFMKDLCAFLLRYCEILKLKPEIIGLYEGSIAIEIPGDVAETFKWIAGSHVVQRVPPTERKGRRHTSTIGISVLSILEVDLTIPDKEIELSETGTSIKAGGQASNRHLTSIRAVHKPTGITVRINGRDQHGNKQKALEVLKSRVADLRLSQAAVGVSADKKAQIGLNNRGSKDFTWSYIDGFVKNHTSGKSCHNIKELERGNWDLLR